MTEFTVTNADGYVVQESHNFATIATAIMSSKERIKEIIDDVRWISKEWFDTNILSNNINIILLSTLTETSLGYLKRKKTGELIAHGEKYQPITEKQYWAKYINGEFYDENIGYTIEELKEFSDKYESVDNFDFRYSMDCLNTIYTAINRKTNLVLMLGSEFPCDRPGGINYENRHLEHKMFNDMIIKWSSDKPNVYTINYTDFIHTQEDYANQIDHFQKRVYYEFTKELVRIVEQITGKDDYVNIRGEKYLKLIEFIEKIKWLFKKVQKI